MLIPIVYTCNPLTTIGIPDIIRGYAVGIVDTTVNQTLTDCYIDSDRLGRKMSIFYNSFVNLSRNTMIDPLKYSNQLFVDLSNQMQSCNVVTLIKQIETRSSHLSGFFDFIFSTSYEIFTDGSLARAFQTIINGGSTLTCAEYGTAIGILVSKIFNYKSPVNDPLKSVKKFND